MRLALIGGEEFKPGFEDIHATLLASAGGKRSRGVYLPTCAAHDGWQAVRYWCELAFEKLSAICTRVTTPLILDKNTADDPYNARLIARADWIYIGGGYPHVGMEILANTRVMDELQWAASRGALIIGASAGAMMMCTRSFVITREVEAEFAAPIDSESVQPVQKIDGLDLAPNSMCIPHFNPLMSQRWLERKLRPRGLTIIGIEEQTALVNTLDHWEVLGRGNVTLLNHRNGFMQYSVGQRELFDLLPPEHDLPAAA